jgi:hypothetical protein
MFFCALNTSLWEYGLLVCKHDVQVFCFSKAHHNKLFVCVRERDKERKRERVCVCMCSTHTCTWLPSRLDTNLFYNKIMSVRNNMAAGRSNEKCYTETGGTWRWLDASVAAG